MSAAATRPPSVRLHEVSRWYGEVLGLNRVTLELGPGVTSLVGPNGSGKSTLMNLIAGLIRPSKGTVEVCGVPADRSEEVHRVLGYCTQHQTFPLAFTGMDWLASLLRIATLDGPAARAAATAALDRVGLLEPRNRRIGSYSKGMKQRLKLALALALDPPVLVLDEPLDGLDPLGRAEIMALFKELAEEGRVLLVSSHILHEVDEISSGVVMLQHGYVVAEGRVQEVRSEIVDRPFQVRIRCDRPAVLAARAFEQGLGASARVDRDGLVVESFDALALARMAGAMAARGDVVVEGLEVADETVQAVYDYLIQPGAGS